MIRLCSKRRFFSDRFVGWGLATGWLEALKGSVAQRIAPGKLLQVAGTCSLHLHGGWRAVLRYRVWISFDNQMGRTIFGPSRTMVPAVSRWLVLWAVKPAMRAEITGGDTLPKLASAGIVQNIWACLFGGGVGKKGWLAWFGHCVRPNVNRRGIACGNPLFPG